MGRMVIRRESLLVVEKAAGNDRNVVCFINGFLFAWGKEGESFVLSEEEIKKAMAVEWTALQNGGKATDGWDG